MDKQETESLDQPAQRPESSKAMSLDEAATVFGGMLDEGSIAEQPDERDDEAVVPEPDADADEPDEGQEDEAEGDADDEAEGDDDESDSDEEQTDEEEEPEAEAPTEIEVDGEVFDAEAIREMRLAQMRADDYTRKTQALADQRREVETLEQDYAGRIAFLDNQVRGAMQQFDNVDWRSLQGQDPAKYQELLEQYRTVTSAVQAIETQRDEFVQSITKARDEAIKARATESVDQLRSLIPGWGQSTYAAIREYAEKQGLSREDFNQIADSAPMVMMYKAMRFDQAADGARKKASKAGAEPEGEKQKPKAPKQKPTRSLGRGPDRNKSLSSAKRRLAKTGSRDDAAAVFAQLLGGDG